MQYLSQVEIVAILTSTLAPSDMERVMIALAQPIHESPGYSGILELLCGQAGFTHDGLDHVDPTSGDHIHEHPHETLLMFWEDQDLGCHAIVNITPWGTSLASEIMTERTVLLVFTMGLAAMVAFIHSMVVVRPLESILSRISACGESILSRISPCGESILAHISACGELPDRSVQPLIASSHPTALFLGPSTSMIAFPQRSTWRMMGP